MKFNTQNKEIEVITETTLILGINVGSETHCVRAFDYRGIKYSQMMYDADFRTASYMRFWITN